MASCQERAELTKLINTGRAAAYRRRHAQILLAADQGEHGPALHDRQIVEKIGVARQTVEKVRKSCVEEGLEAEFGTPPAAHSSAAVIGTPVLAWRRRGAVAGHRLQPTTAETSTVEAASVGRRVAASQDRADDSTRRCAKNEIKPCMWCIPPQQDAAFVCAMEQVLGEYTRRYDAAWWKRTFPRRGGYAGSGQLEHP